MTKDRTLQSFVLLADRAHAWCATNDVIPISIAWSTVYTGEPLYIHVDMADFLRLGLGGTSFESGTHRHHVVVVQGGLEVHACKPIAPNVAQAGTERSA